MLPFVTGAFADAEVHKAPPPAWAEMVAVPEADSARADRIQNGTSYLLADAQMRLNGDGYEAFDRSVYKIVDRPGLERGATIEIVFDPSRHVVTLNRLRLIRDGQVIDQLDKVKVDVYRREKDSERGIFDGRLTAHIDLDGVRVGDIVDYAKTVEVAPIIDKGVYANWFSTQWSEPVGLIRYEVTAPAAKALTIKPVATDVTPRTTEADGNTTYLWEITKPEPTRGEDNVPQDVASSGYVEMTTLPDWQSVVDIVRPYYMPVTDFQSDYAARLDAIAARYPSPKDRLVQAMRLVQDEIRYVSLSIGPGSYVPRRPQAVVDSGFGDCKDKALLLVSILKRFGIEAWPALADIDAGYGLPQRLPSLNAFDHAIVKAHIEGRDYWIDATDYLQGGDADNLVTPDLGFALPLAETDAALEALPPVLRLVPTSSVYEHFSFPLRQGDPMTLSVDTTYRGKSAEWMRYRLRNESVADIARRYIEYYNGLYPASKAPAIW